MSFYDQFADHYEQVFPFRRRTMEFVTDRLGNTAVYYYDDRGNVVLKIDPYGNETDYTYDERDNLLTETDPAKIGWNCSGGMSAWSPRISLIWR